MHTSIGSYGTIPYGHAGMDTSCLLRPEVKAANRNTVMNEMTVSAPPGVNSQTLTVVFREPKLLTGASVCTQSAAWAHVAAAQLWLARNSSVYLPC
eukprot:1160915-Pelagomonas_calceolata.AAC.9